MLKVFDAFAGIGALTRALANIDVEHEATCMSEVDIDAIISYGAMRDLIDEKYEYPTRQEMIQYLKDRNIGVNFKTGECKIDRIANKRLQYCYQVSKKVNNLGDISKINPKDIPDFDIMNFSFPCSDITIAGQQKGLDETRSGLYKYGMDIIEEKQPKYIIIENVKNLISKRFKDGFNGIIDTLENGGGAYNTYYPTDKLGNPKCINALDYGVPQNRERIFVVCIRKDIDSGKFEFPVDRDVSIKLSDVLEINPSDKYFYTNEQIERDINKVRYGELGHKPPENVVSATFELFSREHRHGGWYIEKSPTLTALHNKVVAIPTDEEILDNYFTNHNIRKITPVESFRLMGFTDDDIRKCRKYGISDTQLNKQAGNSIVVNVLEDILKNLLNK